MEQKFKAGDVVRIKRSNTTTAEADRNHGRTAKIKNYYYHNQEYGWCLYLDYKSEYSDGYACVWESDIELVSSSPSQSVHLILQYDLDTDPFETFSTLTEVKDRIKVLARRSDLRRDSLKLYHIAKVEKVELSTAIAFISAEEKPAEQVKTKSKAKQPCP